MKSMKRILALGAFALFISCIGTARAQYQVIGTTAGGGNIIIGHGSLPALGPGAPLTGGGFDQVTVASDGTASASGVDTITFATSHDLLLNNGIIIGDFNQNAIAFRSGGNLSNETVVNNGSISGISGAALSGNSGGRAILFEGSNFSNLTVTNKSTILGGNGDSGSAGINGGDGGNGIFVSASGNLTTLTITNQGGITGGNAGGGGSGAGDGAGAGAVVIQIGGSVNGVTFKNTGGSSITGGNAGSGGAFGGGDGGAGFLLSANSSMSNVMIANAGNSFGGNGGTAPTSGGQGGDGFTIASSLGMTNLTLGNTGLTRGGNGGAGTSNSSGGVGGNGFNVQGGGDITNFLFTNTSTVLGGIGGASTNIDGGGSGGVGVAIEANGNLTGGIVINSGAITGGIGGSGADNASTGGTGMVFSSFTGNLGNLSVTNSASGAIRGGAGGAGGVFDGGAGGDGIDFATGGGPMNGVTLTNNGLFQGGAGGKAGTGGPAGDGGFAISFFGNGTNLSNIVVSNSGIALGGGAGAPGVNFAGGAGGGALGIASDLNITGATVNNTGQMIGGPAGAGGNGGDGITIQSFIGNLNNIAITNNNLVQGSGGGSSASNGGGGGIGINIESNAANGVAIFNNGSVMGGSGGNGVSSQGGDGETGIQVESKQVSNVFILNNSFISGGNGGTGISGNNFGGDGILVGALNNLTNASILNNGTVTGGASGNGNAAGSAVNFSFGAGSNLSVTNFGYLIGGNGTGGAAAGHGVVSQTGNVTVNNWGSITGGAGAGPSAISIGFSSGNVVNLNGHSSVTGLITATGPVDSNILSLNFTGLSPAAIAALKAQVQGLLTGHDSAGSFTVRGVHYTYDPLVLKFNVSSYQLQGVTPNQQAIGAALDSAATNPAPGTPLFKLFNAIDLSGNVPGALESLSPQKFEIYGDLAIQNATGMVLDVDQRLNNLRDGSESVDTTGIGGGSTTAGLTSGFSKDSSKDGKDKVVRTAPVENRWGFFATGNGSFFRANSNNFDLQVGKADSVGTVIGVDGKAGEHAVVGALFAYNNAAVTLGGDGSHATIDSYSGGIYGAYHQDGYYVNGLAAYTRNDYRSTRNIAIPGLGTSAAGSTNGNQATVNIDGGYDFHLTDRLTAGPLLGLQYVHLDVDGFNETGAGAAGLSVGSQSVDSLQSRLGGRIDYKILAQPNVAFAAELHAAWQHEYLNDSRGISAGFEAPGMLPFSVQTQSPLRDSALVGADLNFTFKNRVTLFAGYDLQYWKASYINQTVNGGVRISW